MLRVSLNPFAVVVVLLGLSVLAVGQSGRSYGPERTWWDANRGVVFPMQEEYDNATGELRVFSSQGAVHPEGHAFFTALGSNHRACVTCHQPANAMSLSTNSLRERWEQTKGRDPVFAASDGSNCPSLPQQDAPSHSLLLNRGLIRISLPWPPKTADGSRIKPEFRIDVVRDLTGCNTSAMYGLTSETPMISVYRRPRMVANFAVALVDGMRSLPLMADGRENTLESQAITAVLIHEEAAVHPTAAQLDQIVAFEKHLFVAQRSDVRGGLLTEADAPTFFGPQHLANGEASLMNGMSNPRGAGFDRWLKPEGVGGVQAEFRTSVARGAALFDKACASCHSSGGMRAMDIGTTNLPAAVNTSDMPLFRVVCAAGAAPHPALGRMIYTQDPGRALITGKCADVGSVVMQQLRGLSARAPYFSNGSARTLEEVVNFYDRRFSIGYDQQQKQDLVNFLRAL